MIRGAVLPYSTGGLVGAVMLGLGRAMGETIAVALVIGSSAQITANVLASGDSLPAVIANQWGEADEIQKSALIGWPSRSSSSRCSSTWSPTPSCSAPCAGTRGSEMTLVTDAPPVTPPPAPEIDLSPKRGWRQVKSAIATVLMGAVLRPRPHPSGVRAGHGGLQGLQRRRQGLPEASSPRTSRSPAASKGPGMGPAIVGTLIITARGHGHGRPARHPRRDLPARVRRTAALRPVRALHVVRDGRRAVDRDGPVRLRALDAALRLLGLRRCAGAGLPDAADRDPQRGGDAEARARRRCGRPATPSAPARAAPC